MMDEKEIEDMDVDSAVDTLLKAESHKKNDKLMQKVQEKLGNKKEAIHSLLGLKQKRAKLQKEIEED